MNPTSMIRIKRFRLTLALGLTATLLAFFLATGYSRTSTGSDATFEGPKPTYQVRTIHAPGLPVRIKGDIVPRTNDPESLALRYSITNLTSRDVYGLEVGVYLVSRNGRTRAGQAWRLKNAEVSANSIETFSIALTNKPKPDDSIIVAVQEVSQDGRIWRVNPMPFLQLARISVTSDALATASVISAATTAKGAASARAKLVAYPYSGCGDNFCSGMSAAADTACNGHCGCGVSSFSCDQNACTSSFSCFQCISCQD